MVRPLARLGLLGLLSVVSAQNYPVDGDGWSLVARHHVAAAGDGGDFWPQGGVFRLNPENPTSNMYAILDELERFRQPDGTLVFKLRYPGMCEILGQQCIDGKDYQIFTQTSNPYSQWTQGFGGTTGSVENLQPVDVAYLGRGANTFDGLATTWSRATSTARHSIFDGNADHENWWFCVCNTRGFGPGNQYMPAMDGYYAAQMELSVWGPGAPAQGDTGWMPVFRQLGGAALWPATDPPSWSVNSDAADPARIAQFAALDTLENYRTADGVILFKLVYPTVCDFGFRGADCWDTGRNWITWSQTNNPTADGPVSQYREVDAGGFRSSFQGLRCDTFHANSANTRLLTCTSVHQHRRETAGFGGLSPFLCFVFMWPNHAVQCSIYRMENGVASPFTRDLWSVFLNGFSTFLRFFSRLNRGWVRYGGGGSHPLLVENTDLTTYSVGATANYSGTCGTCLPGPVGMTGPMQAPIVELYVWGPHGRDACPAGEFSQAVDGRYTCARLTQCAAGTTFQNVAPTRNSDRGCGPVSSCGPMEFEMTAPTALDDRVCALVDVCGQHQYELTPATATSNRICIDDTICAGPIEEEVRAPTPTTDRVCIPAAQWCPADSYMGPNGGCLPATQCTAGVQYLRSAAHQTADNNCVARTTCGAGEFVAAPATTTTDTVCVAASACDAGIEQPTGGTTAGGDVLCEDRCSTVCGNGEALQTPCTERSQRTCTGLSTPPTTAVPAISADGLDLALSPASGGKVVVTGGLQMNGADVGAWLQSLQSELQTLRDAVQAKDAAARQELVAVRAENVALQHRVSVLEECKPTLCR